MSAGIPVVASARGSLPEVVGDAGALVDPTDADALAHAIDRAIRDQGWATRAAEAGLLRARRYDWGASAATLGAAYRAAVERRRGRP
jgi:glycosyltransferase involved in cell wall biosynthesis